MTESSFAVNFMSFGLAIQDNAHVGGLLFWNRHIIGVKKDHNLFLYRLPQGRGFKPPGVLRVADFPADVVFHNNLFGRAVVKDGFHGASIKLFLEKSRIL